MKISGYDKVKIMKSESLSYDDYSVLSLLYLPLIGSKAYSIYTTLYAYIDRSNFENIILHKELVDILGLSLTVFESERKKLEAIGLLNVYLKNDTIDEYTYLLKSPLSAKQFIKDGLLGSYLYSTVGEELFKKIIEKLSVSKFDKEGYQNITSPFDKVFKNSVTDEVIPDLYFLDKKEGNVKVTNNSFDFDFFVQGLSINFIDKNNISKKFEDEILKLSYSFNFNEQQMQEVYYKSLVNGKLEFDNLSKEAYKKYELEGKKNSIKTKDAGLDILEYLEKSSPIDILEGLLGSGNVSIAQTNLVSKLYDELGLDPIIVGVLIIYVWKKTNMTIPSYNYFLEVSKTWKSKNINTAEKAVEFLLNNEKENEVSNNTTTTNNNGYTSSNGNTNYYKNKNNKNASKKKYETDDWFEDFKNSLKEK